MTLQRDSGLLAIICDDLVVRLLDIETHRIVREFGGFGGRVLDLVGLPLLGLLSWSHRTAHIDLLFRLAVAYNDVTRRDHQDI
jgi:hypothetical protein